MNKLIHFSKPKCFILLILMMMSFMICMKFNVAYALTSLVEQPTLQETVEQVSEPITMEVDTEVVPTQEILDFDHELIEPDIEVVEKTVDEAVDPIIGVVEAVDEVVNEINEPIIETVDDSFAPIIEVVNESTEPVVEVIDEISDQATEVIRETTEPIAKLDDVIIKPKISNGWIERLVPAIGENNNIPVSNHKPLTHQTSKIVLNHNVSQGTGSSTTDQSGSSGSNIMGYIKAKTLLSKSIIVTRNYAHDFILMNQWSNAPPGQPPKTTSSQPHMNL